MTISELLAELFDLGLASAMRSDEGNGLSIFPPVINAQETDDGFGALLRDAMTENVDKLREAKPRETHLVVTLDRSDLSPDPVRTPAPNCPMALTCCGSCLATSTRSGRTACGERRQATVDGIFCGIPSASRLRSTRPHAAHDQHLLKERPD